MFRLISMQLRLRLREYLREQVHHNQLLRVRSISDNFSPALQASLTLETASGILQKTEKRRIYADVP